MRKTISIVLVCVLLLGVLFSFAYAQEEVMQIENTDYGKISPELQEKLDTMETDESIRVYVLLCDVEPEDVLGELAARYPEEYEEYIFAKEGDVTEGIFKGVNADVDYKESIEYAEYEDPVDDVLLQSAIEHKREIYREFYNTHNEWFINKYLDRNSIIFVSQYSPMIIAELSKSDIQKTLEAEEVIWIEEYYEMEFHPLMSTANQTTEVQKVRDVYGKKGAGVKIGMIEDSYGIPNVSFTELSGQNIICYNDGYACTNDHSTCVATALVGKTKGAAPSATLYCIYAECLNGLFYEPVEWLLNQGVNIINSSMGIDILNTNGDHSYGHYNVVAKWIDHIALNHDVHFVQAAGNKYPDNMITTQGMAYNAITVGGYLTKKTVTDNDDSMYAMGSYAEENITYRPEKPNLIAPASGFEPGNSPNSSIDLDFGNAKYDSGTSYSAAQVAGVMAQLCSTASALKTKQTAMGAILASGAYRKINVQQQVTNRDYHFVSTESISGSDYQISNKEGAGKLNAQGSWYSVYSGQYWGLSVSASSFPYNKTVYISASDNSLIRISIFWLIRNYITGSHLSENPNYYYNGTFDDLNLKVKDPNGNVIGYSHTTYSNFEIVQFIPTISGNYTITVEKGPSYGSGSTAVEPLGIAIW